MCVGDGGRQAGRPCAQVRPQGSETIVITTISLITTTISLITTTISLITIVITTISSSYCAVYVDRRLALNWGAHRPRRYGETANEETRNSEFGLSSFLNLKRVEFLSAPYNFLVQRFHNSES